VTRIEHVSDTALWVATYRAMESERPDALFRDPYARRLIGGRGEEIVDAIPGGRGSAWAMIVRTAVMDEIILRAVGEGLRQVVNLAAGLDARPYRLDLPADLRWVEVDLPALLAHKRSVLADDTPVCALETVELDLSDREGRRRLFGELDARGLPTLVVSEGLLVYLEPDEVASLARDLHAAPSFGRWLIDLASPKLLKMMKRRYSRGMDVEKVPFRFGPAEGPAFFEPHGWRAAEVRSHLVEAHRLGREMRGAWIPRLVGRLFPKKGEEIRRMGTVVLLARA